MPTQVPAATPVPLLREEVRMFLRDVPGVIPGSGSENVLLDDVEFSDRELALATRLAVSRFNTMRPPIRQLVAEQIPLDILIVGVVSFLLNSESFRQLRNQSSVPDGETSLGIDDKHQLYAGARQRIYEEFTELATNWKVMKNMAACWGGVNSGFAYLWSRPGLYLL